MENAMQQQVTTTVPSWAALAATVALAVLIAAAACSVLVAVVASWRTRETKR